MTTHTKYLVTCTCGHVGTLKMSENDQPYSKQYESYSLDGLKGSNYGVDGFATWEKVFEEMRPICPKCNAALTLSQLSE